MDALEMANQGLEIDEEEEERRLDQEIFGEDIDLVNDPTYVPPAPGTDPVAGPSGVAVTKSKGKSLPAKPLFTSPVKALHGGRSKHPIWKFYKPVDKVVPNITGVGTMIAKFAECQVKRGGVICGAILKQGLSSTTGLNSHLASQHPKCAEEIKAEKVLKATEKTGAKRNISHLYALAEGKNIHYLYRSYRIYKATRYNTIQMYRRRPN